MKRIEFLRLWKKWILFGGIFLLPFSKIATTDNPKILITDKLPRNNSGKLRFYAIFEIEMKKLERMSLKEAEETIRFENRALEVAALKYIRDMKKALDAIQKRG